MISPVVVIKITDQGIYPQYILSTALLIKLGYMNSILISIIKYVGSGWLFILSIYLSKAIGNLNGKRALIGGILGFLIITILGWIFRITGIF